MKVFIGWSGDESRRVALVLREWLPMVIQGVDPFVSSIDIDKGSRWEAKLSEELEATSFGILCLTPDNLDSPWLNYEAGAISRSVDARVCPVLHQVQQDDVQGPMARLQMTSLADEEDVMLMMTSINHVTPTSLSDRVLRHAVKTGWPELAEQLADIPVTPGRRSRGLAEVVRRIDAGSHERRTIEKLLAGVVDLLRARHTDVEYRALVTIADHTTGSRRTVCGVNIDVDPEVTLTVPIDFGIAGEAYLSKAMRLGDVTADNRDLGTDGSFIQGIWPRVAGVVAFPLVAGDGEAIGTVNFDCDAPLASAGLDDRRVQGALHQAVQAVALVLDGSGNEVDASPRHFRR